MRDVFSTLPAVAGAAPVLSSSDTFVFAFAPLLVDDRLVFLAFFVELRFAFHVMYKQYEWLYDRGMVSINIMASGRKSVLTKAMHIILSLFAIR